MFAKIKKKRDQKLFEAYIAQMNLVNPKSISYNQVKSLNKLHGVVELRPNEKKKTIYIYSGCK